MSKESKQAFIAPPKDIGGLTVFWWHLPDESSGSSTENLGVSVIEVTIP
jgi:hypothetical protein